MIGLTFGPLVARLMMASSIRLMSHHPSECVCQGIVTRCQGRSDLLRHRELNGLLRFLSEDVALSSDADVDFHVLTVRRDDLVRDVTFRNLRHRMVLRGSQNRSRAGKRARPQTIRS